MSVELFHMPNAICAQKVRVCLAEKGVLYSAANMEGKLRDPDYLRLNPNGYVPTLVHEGRILLESRIISEYINEAFDGPELLPRDPYERARVSLWTKQIDDTLHLNIFTLSFVAIFRELLMQRSSAERQTFLAFDITKRERTIDMFEHGWNSRYVESAVSRFMQLIVDMESTLQNHDYLIGGAYSLADADFAPYLKRLYDIGLSGLWRSMPRVTAWFDRVRGRPSFDEVIVRWNSPEQIERAAAHRTRSEPRFEAIVNRLNAVDGAGSVSNSCSL
jgi:glutathione S-transferase